MRLCPFSWEQAQQYLHWVNDPEIARQLTRALPVSELEHRGWYESVVKRSDAVMFSVMVGEDYVGNVWLWGIHPVHRLAELRIVMNPAFAGRGHGTSACRALLDFAFQQLNLNKVFLYVLQSNLAARRCFEKAGLAEEAVLKQEFFVDGEYVDAVRMAAWARK